MFMGSNSSGGVSTGRTPPRLCWIVVCGEITSLLPLPLLLVTPPPLFLALSSLSSIVARAITSNRETPQAKTIPLRDETASSDEKSNVKIRKDSSAKTKIRVLS